MKNIHPSDLFALFALVLLIFGFTLPVVLFYTVPEKIRSEQFDRIPAVVYPLWNLYQTGRYVSPYTPKGAERDLKQLIARKAEIGVMSLPLWAVSLEAPNYPAEAFPNGIPVYFHLDGYSGDVHEMNTINHFIGMYPMEAGAKLEKTLSPFILLWMTGCLILFLMMPRSRAARWLVMPTLFFPLGFFAIYSGWLYWYGHHLQEWGMFKVKPFMPTALGDGKVAQFTTHSYPSIGFYILVIIAVLSAMAFLARTREQKQ